MEASLREKKKHKLQETNVRRNEQKLIIKKRIPDGFLVSIA